MANYPTGVYGPSAVSNGQTIDAGRDNSQDAEITAVENGLLNGLAHAISVTAGGITQSASTGVNSFAGPVTFTGRVLPTVPTCIVTHSVAQNIPAGAESECAWDTEIVDAHGMHSTDVASSRITFAASTGFYKVWATVHWSNPSTGGYYLRIRHNDSSGVAMNALYFAASGTVDMCIETMARAGSTSDYVTLRVFQGGASTNSITNSTNGNTRFGAHLVSL